MTSIYRALAGSTTPNAISKGLSKSRVTPDSYHSTLSLRDNLTVCFHLESLPTHSTLSLRDILTVCFHLSGTITFRLTLRASCIHTEILGYLPGLLHPKSRILTLGDLRPPFFFTQHTLITLHFMNQTMSLHWT